MFTEKYMHGRSVRKTYGMTCILVEQAYRHIKIDNKIKPYRCLLVCHTDGHAKRIHTMASEMLSAYNIIVSLESPDTGDHSHVLTMRSVEINTLENIVGRING